MLVGCAVVAVPAALELPETTGPLDVGLVLVADVETVLLPAGVVVGNGAAAVPELLASGLDSAALLPTVDPDGDVGLALEFGDVLTGCETLGGDEAVMEFVGVAVPEAGLAAELLAGAVLGEVTADAAGVEAALPAKGELAVVAATTVCPTLVEFVDAGAELGIAELAACAVLGEAEVAELAADVDVVPPLAGVTVEAAVCAALAEAVVLATVLVLDDEVAAVPIDPVGVVPPAADGEPTDARESEALSCCAAELREMTSCGGVDWLDWLD